VPRYKLTIAYDGTDFCGWQKQEPAPTNPAGEPSVRPELVVDQDDKKLYLRTVQHIVEQAVREVVREPIDLLGASRTDAGVHAGGSFPDGAPGGQVAAFTCSQLAPEGRGWPTERGVEPMVRAINARLPDDVLVHNAEIVDDRFNPIGDCVSKGYRYTIHVSPTRPLWDRRYVCHMWKPVNIEHMKQAAAHLVGNHDFAAFAAVNHGRQTTVRTIHACDVLPLPSGERVSRKSVTGEGFSSFFKEPGASATGHSSSLSPKKQVPSAQHEAGERAQRIAIDVSGNGFLYNMVRIIAGTLHDVGRGKIDPDDIPAILASADRRRAGPTMPPEGLRLEWIRY